MFRSVFVPATRKGWQGRYLLASVCCLAQGVTLRDAAVVVVGGSLPRQRQQPLLLTTRNGRGEHVLDTLNPRRHHEVGSAEKEVFGLELATDFEL